MMSARHGGGNRQPIEDERDALTVLNQRTPDYKAKGDQFADAIRSSWGVFNGEELQFSTARNSGILL